MLSDPSFPSKSDTPPNNGFLGGLEVDDFRYWGGKR